MRDPKMQRLLSAVPVALAAAVGLSGCGSVLPGHLGGIVTEVKPQDYGEQLCGHLDLEDYPSCVSNVLDYFEVPLAQATAEQSTSGPFVVVMEKDYYSGTYSSQPFAASFRVTNGANGCRGSYNIFNGSRDALFDVYCDDGRAGWADIILDTDGRNGIGQLALNDGTLGKIVFGYKVLGRAPTYPWGNVWTVRPEAREPVAF